MLYPIYPVVYRIIHLRNNRATPSTPLSTHFPDSVDSSSIRIIVNNYLHSGSLSVSLPSSILFLAPSHISTAIKQAVIFLGPSALGFISNKVSARSLRVSIVMALFDSKVKFSLFNLLVVGIPMLYSVICMYKQNLSCVICHVKWSNSVPTVDISTTLFLYLNHSISIPDVVMYKV